MGRPRKLTGSAGPKIDKAKLLGTLLRDRLTAKVAATRRRELAAREGRRAQLAVLRDRCADRRLEVKASCAAGRAGIRAEALAEIERARAARAAELTEYREGRAAELAVARQRAPRVTGAERRLESDSDVLAEIPAELIPVWNAWKRQIRARPGMSRAEVFLHAVEEDPAEVLAIRSAAADAWSPAADELAAWKASSPRVREIEGSALADVPF